MAVKEAEAVSRVTVVSVLAVLCFPASAEDVEFRLEGVYRWDSSSGYLNWSLEEWPASIEARIPPVGSEQSSWAGIAFSLSSEPVTHEAYRLGFAFDADDEDAFFLPQRGHRDDRVYLYARCEPDWLPDSAILRLMYPLAEQAHGYEWYWRVEIEDLQYDLARWEDCKVGLTANLSYSPDPELGFAFDYGLRLSRDDAWITVMRDTISLGWTGTTSSL